MSAMMPAQNSKRLKGFDSPTVSVAFYCYLLHIDFFNDNWQYMCNKYIVSNKYFLKVWQGTIRFIVNILCDLTFCM